MRPQDARGPSLFLLKPPGQLDTLGEKDPLMNSWQEEILVQTFREECVHLCVETFIHKDRSIFLLELLI